MGRYLEAAKVVRAAMDAAAAVLTDEQALRAAALYPAWDGAVQYGTGTGEVTSGTNAGGTGAGTGTNAGTNADGTSTGNTGAGISGTGTGTNTGVTGTTSAPGLTAGAVPAAYATVTSPDGGPVKLRKSASRGESLYWLVGAGARVRVERTRDGWSLVTALCTDGYTRRAWMMDAYLRR